MHIDNTIEDLNKYAGRCRTPPLQEKYSGREISDGHVVLHENILPAEDISTSDGNKWEGDGEQKDLAMDDEKNQTRDLDVNQNYIISALPPTN